MNQIWTESGAEKVRETQVIFLGPSVEPRALSFNGFAFLSTLTVCRSSVVSLAVSTRSKAILLPLFILYFVFFFF